MSIEQHLFTATPPTFPAEDRADPRLVRPRQLGTLVKWAQSSKVMSVDFECDGLKPWKGATPHAFGFYEPKAGAKVVDLRFLAGCRDAAVEAVRDALKGRTGETRFHNASMELMHTQAFLGVEIGGGIWDNYDAAFALNELRTQRDADFGPYSQKGLVRAELGREAIFAKAVHAWLKSTFGAEKSRWKYNLLPAELHTNYLCEDVKDCFELGEHFLPQVEREGMLELVRIDSELQRCIADMSLFGLRIDFDGAMRLHEELARGKAQAVRRLADAAGRPIDPASSTKLFGLFFGHLHLPQHPDAEKTGKLDDSVLSWMLTLEQCKEGTAARECVEAVRDYREAHVLDDTFIMPWLYEYRDGDVIHPDLDARGTDTRRFSSRKPNLQNIPNDPRVRGLIMAPEGMVSYSVDESQGEYRIFTHYCGEPRLVRGYREDPNFDIHQDVANALGLPRKPAKNLNFGILFGMGKDKLARSLLVTKQRAQEILDDYYSKLPTIKKLKRDIETTIKKRGYLKSVLNGRRHLKPDEHYKGLNTLTQMSIADILRRAMVMMRPALRKVGGWMQLQVHDEVLFSLPGTSPAEHVDTIQEVNRSMTEVKLRVPLKSDTEYWTTNWAEAKPLEAA